MVAIRVELRPQEREAQRVTGKWRDVEEPPSATRAKPEPRREPLARETPEPPPPAAEPLPLAAAERAVAAYTFQRAQFEPMHATPTAHRLDVRA